MRKGDGYTLVFATAICLVCSLLLSAVSSGLRERQQTLAELARRLNVLRAFGADVLDAEGKRLPMEEIGAMFDERVEQVFVDAGTGNIVEADGIDPLDTMDDERWLPLYRWRVDGEVTRFAFPISGPGLWGPISGYLALERDGRTVAGITFYDHQETPGLGGEIEQEWFQEQFRGKSVYADGELRSVRVVKGSVRDRYPDGNPHAVDGISGATLTGQGVTDLIAAGLERYEVFFQKIREG